jgi:hypothetical protein
MNGQVHTGYHRGTMQPETKDQERKRLHREATARLKEAHAAFKEAKARYLQYDKGE